MSNSERDCRISLKIKISLIESIISPMIREMEEINFRNNVMAFIHMIEDVDELVSDRKSEFWEFWRISGVTMPVKSDDWLRFKSQQECYLISEEKWIAITCERF